MRAIAALREYFARPGEIAAVYLYGRYGNGPSFPDTDIEIGLVFPETASEDDIRDYLEHLSDENPLGGEPGILMPFALNAHVLPVIYEILAGGSLLTENDPVCRSAFVESSRARIEAERATLLDESKEAIMQARSLGLAVTATSGYVLPQPPRYLDPIRIGWRLSRIMASAAVLEVATRDIDSIARDPDRMGQAIGWFSNAAGAATGIAKAMLNMFDMERPPRRWQVFLPIADAGLIPMDLALHLSSQVEMRWQLLASAGMHSAERVLNAVRGGLPQLIAFAKLAAWYCEVPGGTAEARVH